MLNTIEVPPGCYAMEVPCAKCQRMIYTFSESDPSELLTVKVKQEKAGRFGILPSYAEKRVNLVDSLAAMTYCNDCADAEIEDRKKKERTTREMEWEHICPAEFRRLDPSRLPYPSKLDRVMQWNYGGRGLLLCGPTGSGKSRSAWSLVKREFFRGRSVAVIDCMFAIHYTKQVSISGAAAFEWLDEKIKANVLLMDDALKVKLDNSGAEAALFAIVNDRVENKRPIVITMQDAPDTLAARMSDDRGKALLRRLKEFCDNVIFVSGK